MLWAVCSVATALTSRDFTLPTQTLQMRRLLLTNTMARPGKSTTTASCRSCQTTVASPTTPLSALLNFMRVSLGNEEHVENLNYVEKCLGKTVEQYFVKDFWKDHKKTYQNRPIYWLFSSRKGAFQVIAYMHRMNAYTAERVRSKYLLPYIEHLEAEIDKLDARRAELSTKESKQLQALQKQLDECREYHERLQVVAEQAISFDLDDGVVVNYAKFGDILQKIK